MDLQPLLSVSSINATLSVLLVDGEVALGHDGVDDEDNEAILDACQQAAAGDAATLAIGEAQGTVVHLGMGLGHGSLYQLGDGRYVFAEPDLKTLLSEKHSDKRLQAWRAALTADFQLRVLSTLSLRGILVVCDPFDVLSEAASAIRALAAQDIGASVEVSDESHGRALRVAPGSYEVRRQEVDLDGLLAALVEIRKTS